MTYSISQIEPVFQGLECGIANVITSEVLTEPTGLIGYTCYQNKNEFININKKYPYYRYLYIQC